MKSNATIETSIAALTEALGATHTEDTSNYFFRLSVNQFWLEPGEEKEFTAKLPKSRLKEIVESVNQLEILNETILLSDNSFELLIRDESPIGARRMSRRQIEIDDMEYSMQYRVAPATDEYLLFLLLSLSRTGLLSSLTDHLSFDLPEEGEVQDPSPFELLKENFSRFRTLRLTTNKKRSAAEFSRFADSFVFQISYNLEIALVQQRSLDEVIRIGRLARCKRLQVNEIGGPRRAYITSLVYHYQLAVAADNLFLQYLSYYHIVEHFFEEVFSEELVNKVTDRITRPDFSYRRRKDIEVLIKEISKAASSRSDSLVKSEQEALRLTLGKYIDISTLKTELDQYDNSLVPHYKNCTVPFASADPTDLDSGDIKATIKSLSARVYKVRNSLVHSKEGDKSNYRPFVDDRALRKEVPLIRFIAEQILIASSTEL